MNPIPEDDPIIPRAQAPAILDELAKNLGGKIEEIAKLPDGSGFATLSMPLPADHWLYKKRETMDPPAPLRLGSNHPLRALLGQMIEDALKYAYKASSSDGKIDDIDPDALLQNMNVGMFGYWTEDGFSHLD